MPVRVSAEDASSKWLNRLQQSTPQIQAGVQRVTQAPGQKAAAQRALWAQRITASQDKWARNVSRVSLPEWQNAMLSVGVPRIAQGAAAKQDKYTNFMQDFLPHLAQGVAQVERMPKGGVEQGIARAAQMIRWNSQFRRGGSAYTPGAGV